MLKFIPLDKIDGIQVGLERKVETAQWESLKWDVTLKIKEGVPLEAIMGYMEFRVELTIAASAQVREARAEFFTRMLRRLAVPVQDIEAAFAVLGWAMPESVLDYIAITEEGGAIETLLAEIKQYGPQALPLEWVWWKDGKHPHPLKNVKPVISDEGQFEAEADESPAAESAEE